MAFRLPRLPAVEPAWGVFQAWWQRVIEAIEAQEDNQDAIINRIRRLLSHTNPTTILKAEEVGGAITITVLPHTRIYADGTTVSLAGAAYTGKSPDVWYACYYDDLTLANVSPTFVFTEDIQSAQANLAEGRHFCGLIQTPALGSGEIVESGGAYPPSAASVGAELE